MGPNKRFDGFITLQKIDRNSSSLATTITPQSSLHPPTLFIELPYSSSMSASIPGLSAADKEKLKAIVLEGLISKHLGTVLGPFMIG
jgi:hypothetical protein